MAILATGSTQPAAASHSRPGPARSAVERPGPVGTRSLGLAQVRALRSLVDAISDLEGLLDQVGPLQLPRLDIHPAADELVHVICTALGVPASFSLERAPTCAEKALVRRLEQSVPDGSVIEEWGRDREAAARAAVVWRAHENRELRRHRLTRADGTELTVVEAGGDRGPTLVLASACGMSSRLANRWLRTLGSTMRCLTLETRGTSGRLGDGEEFDARGVGVLEQTADLVAILEAHTDGDVHLMGLCGGAVNALAAAAERPDLVASLSLWHGDFELGGESSKTPHQQNLRDLLDLASGSRESAAELRGVLADTPLTGVPESLGPLVVRPYVHDELFYRYARLTAATMHWDSRPVLDEVSQPVLVVTSRDDSTAHPDGSMVAASRLRCSHLHIDDHGTHLEAFSASAAHRDLLESFLVEQELTEVPA